MPWPMLPPGSWVSGSGWAEIIPFELDRLQRRGRMAFLPLLPPPHAPTAAGGACMHCIPHHPTSEGACSAHRPDRPHPPPPRPPPPLVPRRRRTPGSSAASLQRPRITPGRAPGAVPLQLAGLLLVPLMLTPLVSPEGLPPSHGSTHRPLAPAPCLVALPWLHACMPARPLSQLPLCHQQLHARLATHAQPCLPPAWHCSRPLLIPRPPLLCCPPCFAALLPALLFLFCLGHVVDPWHRGGASLVRFQVFVFGRGGHLMDLFGRCPGLPGAGSRQLMCMHLTTPHPAPRDQRDRLCCLDWDPGRATPASAQLHPLAISLPAARGPGRPARGREPLARAPALHADSPLPRPPWSPRTRVRCACWRVLGAPAGLPWW